MRTSLLPVLGFLALSSSQFAYADNLVPGSSFNVQLQQNDATANTIVTSRSVTLTPGGTTTFTFGSATGTISESYSVLAGGIDDFTFTVTSASDLFPEYVAGDSYIGSIGVGDLTALQFETPFDVTAAYLSFASPSGYILAPDDVLPTQPDPFNGSYPNFGKVEGYIPIGGRDTTSIVLSIEGTAIPPATPEPSSLVLLGTGILGVAGAAPRKFLKA